MGDSEEYLRRIQGLVNTEDPLAIQASTPARIANLVADVPDSKIRVRQATSQWAIVEILAHLAEDELVASWRYRQMLEAPGCALSSFDQDRWAAYGRYSEWDAAAALAMFRLLREANLRLLRGLTEGEWLRWGVHEERGRITVRDLAAHMAGHDLNHVEQICGRLRTLSEKEQECR